MTESVDIPRPMGAGAPPTIRPRVMLMQLAIVFAVLFGTRELLRLVVAPHAGQIAVLVAVLALAWLLRGEKAPLASVGLVRPRSVWRTLVAGVLCVIGAYAAALTAIQIGGALGWPSHLSSPADSSLPLLVVGLVIAWTTAAVGEEVLFRGFLQSRLQRLFGSLAFAGVFAALMQAVIFGLAHAYQGPTGMLLTGAIGLVFGLARLPMQSIWPLVIAHGIIDTISAIEKHSI